MGWKNLVVQLELCLIFLFSIIYVVQSCLLALVPRRFRRRDIRGRVALITGGAMGIGRITAMRLASKGAKVIIWDINSQECAETVSEIRSKGGQSFSYIVDISDADKVKDAAEQVKQDHGPVNILVNNAGVSIVNDSLNDDEALIEKQFKINAISHFWTLRAFLPDMKKAKEGHIVSMSSSAGKFGCPMAWAYCATKFAVCGLDESLRYELDYEGLENITTTLVCPFFVNAGIGKDYILRVYDNVSVEDLADEIVDAILLRTRRVYLPKPLKILVALKGLGHQKIEWPVTKAAMGHTFFKQLEQNKKKQM